MKNYTRSSVYREKTTKEGNGDNPYNYQHGLLPLNQPAPFERKKEKGALLIPGMVNHIDGPLVKFFESASDETCSAHFHHHTYGLPHSNPASAEHRMRQTAGDPQGADHVYAHARQVWISSTSYDFWII